MTEISNEEFLDGLDLISRKTHLLRWRWITLHRVKGPALRLLDCGALALRIDVHGNGKLEPKTGDDFVAYAQDIIANVPAQLGVIAISIGGEDVPAPLPSDPVIMDVEGNILERHDCPARYPKPNEILEFWQTKARPHVKDCEQAAFICSIHGLLVDNVGHVIGTDPCCAPAWFIAALNDGMGFFPRNWRAQDRAIPIIRRKPTYFENEKSGKRRSGEMIRKEPVESLWGKPPSDSEIEAYFKPKDPRTFVEWRVGDLIWEIEHDFQISATRAAIVVRNAITRGVLELIGSDQRYLFSLLKREDELNDLPNWLYGGDWYENTSVMLNFFSWDTPLPDFNKH